MSEGAAASSPAGASRPAEPPGGVGPTLRARREQLGWALPDVATWLRIRLPTLEALEEGRVQDLPGNVYAIGFLRTYAQALGLDAESLAARFKSETRGSIDTKPELSFPEPVPERTMPAGVMALLGGVVIVIAYIGWYRMTDVQPPPQPVPSVSSAIPGLVRQGTTSPQVASVLPPERPTAPPQPLSSAEKSAITADDMPAAPATPAAQPSPPPALPTPVQPAPAIPATPAPGATDAATPAPPTAATPTTTPTTIPGPDLAGPSLAPPPVPGQITLTATARTWVRLRQAAGPVLYEHVLQPGDSWSIPPDKANVLLTVGNAGGLVLTMDGITTPPLGRPGAVRHNLVLSPDAIRNGSIAAPAPAGDPTAGAPTAATATTPPATIPH
ncbi:RodZ domain-containing protein [Nguyenibacter vanlangensis]|uniref:RodZ domain-containing protein n=1 Tax=Nguyenibacter vanlangensis TaxID=1216886 RepID=A0ABZ3D6M2_9PROT